MVIIKGLGKNNINNSSIAFLGCIWVVLQVKDFLNDSMMYDKKVVKVKFWIVFKNLLVLWRVDKYCISRVKVSVKTHNDVYNKNIKR